MMCGISTAHSLTHARTHAAIRTKIMHNLTVMTEQTQLAART